MTPEELQAIIDQQVAEPEDATVDGNRTKNRPLKDLFAAQDRIQAQAAGSGWGRNMARVRLPDAVGPTSVTTDDV